MKFILSNIHHLFKRQLCLFLFVFCITALASAQDSTREDDSVDSTQMTITETQNENHFTDKSEYTQPDTIQLREVPGNVVDSMKKDGAFWYADHVFKKKEIREREFKERRPGSPWLNMMTLVIIVVIFFIILLWFLFKNNIISRSKTISDKTVEEEESAENIFDINYQLEIEKAIKAENYRLAIRLMFLRLLKNLSQKNIIQYKQERTNFDYLSQLYTTSYYKEFFRLTRNYEYTWYGKFDVNTETFGIIKNEFENFDRKLS